MRPRDHRCPLCALYTLSRTADLRPNRRHPPGAGEPFVCGYCGYVARFTGNGAQVEEAPPALVAEVKATPAHRNLIAGLRAKHYGKDNGGPKPDNGIFERTIYKKPDETGKDND